MRILMNRNDSNNYKYLNSDLDSDYSKNAVFLNSLGN